MLRRHIKAVLEYPLLLTAGWRRLPDFIIIGAQKSGTTSLFDYLTMHPEVLKNPLNYKELYFFNTHYQRGMKYYRHYFPLKFRSGLVGEATTTYLHSLEAPARVAQCLPEVKLILTLRDPVDRAISHYYHHVKRGRESRTLDEAFSQDYLDRFNSGKLEDDKFTYRYLNNSNYARHLANWQQHFMEKRFCINAAEDMFERPQEVYDQACDFLGLKRVHLPEFKVRNKGSERKEIREIEQRLCEFYRPHVAQLYASPLIKFRWERFY